MSSEPTIFLCACLLSLGLTAIVKQLAPVVGLTDKPDGNRKLHGNATPVGGGVAVFLTSVIVLSAIWLFPNQLQEPLRAGYPDLPALLIGSAIIVLLGLVDDRFGLRGRDKLVGQIVACSTLIFGGLVIENIQFFGYEFNLGLLAIPLTLLWLLGAINSLNLLDGIDGLATMLGIILSCTIAILAAIYCDNTAIAVVAMVFAGSLIGFLRFNFPPASIFLGDTGSMLIGLVVGALAIRGSLKGPGTVLLTAPLAVWMLPILDVVAAIMRRKLTGRSIYATDRGHLHHRLLGFLGTNRRVLAWVAVSCAVTSFATLVSVFCENDMIAVGTCAAVLLIFVVTGAFGRVELMLLGTRLRQMSSSFVPSMRSSNAPHESTIRLQGSKQWDVLWRSLLESTRDIEVSNVRLNLHLPVIGESFHAIWEHPRRKGEPEDSWRVDVPLRAIGRVVGSVAISGTSSEESTVSDQLARLAGVLKCFESQIERFIEMENAPLPVQSTLGLRLRAAKLSIHNGHSGEHH